MVNKKAETIDIKANSNKEFFLIHGYTGSPTDFNELPDYLRKEFNANVKVIRLEGHGTNIEDLDDIAYIDILKPLEEEIEKDLKKGRKIVLGGVSLGAILALNLSSRYNVEAVFNICAPYKLNFPFRIAGIDSLLGFKKYWKKSRKPEEKKMRKESFSYDYMHVNGIKVAKEASRELSNSFNKINCPVLTIHSIGDSIGDYHSAYEINDKIKSKNKRMVILNGNIHNVFFSLNNSRTYNEIIDFLHDKNIFSRSFKEKVSAIIPTYNEAERIGNVLNVLKKAKIFDEIIVVDDCSNDGTKGVIGNFRNVKYLRNKINMGKAYSMDRAVKNTKSEVIFFCDADLIGLTTKIVKEIVSPVIKGDVEMFVGLRNNFMQRAVHLFSVNSGERAMRRDVWESLPEYFKKRYRIEAGLNYYVKKYLGGFGYKIFDYSQTTKEKKYGFFRGTFLRWWMNFDVSLAYLRAIFDNLFK